MANITGISEPDLSAQMTFRTVKLTLYGIIFLVAVSGNLLVICTIIKFKRQRTFPNVFVLNLSLCDICLVLLSIPFDIVNDELGYFYFGRFGCRLLYPVATLAMNSAVFTLLVITCERYVAIIHPFSFVLTKTKVGLILTLLHVASLLSVLPYGWHLTLSTEGYPSCNETWSKTSRKIYTIVLFLLQYGLPLPIIMGMSVIAWNKIRSNNDEIIRITEAHASLVAERYARQNESAQPSPTNCPTKKPAYRFDVINGLRRRLSIRRPDKGYAHESSLERYKQTKRTLKMFTVVVIVFGTFMLPSQVVWLWTDFGSGTGPSELTTSICYILMYTNSVLNPWIYGGVNSSFRKAYTQMLLSLKCGIVSSCTSWTKRRSNETRSILLPLNTMTELPPTNVFSWVYEGEDEEDCNKNTSKETPGIQQNGNHDASNGHVATTTATKQRYKEVWRNCDCTSFERRLSQSTLERLMQAGETEL